MRKTGYTHNNKTKEKSKVFTQLDQLLWNLSLPITMTVSELTSPNSSKVCVKL